jgi:carboxyl-terminal processing protease
MNTKYFNNLFSNNVVREYTLHYYELNKKKLEKMQLDEFVEDFEVTSSMLNDLIKIASRSNVPFDQKEFEASKDLIKTTVKAHIAKSMWHNEGYYKVFNETNEVLQQGLNLFDEAEELAMN